MNEEVVYIEQNLTRSASIRIVINKLNSSPVFDVYDNKRALAAILLQRTEEKHENLAFLLTVINKHPEIGTINNVYNLVNYIIVLIDMEKANKDFVVEVDPNDFL